MGGLCGRAVGEGGGVRGALGQVSRGGGRCGQASRAAVRGLQRGLRCY